MNIFYLDHDPQRAAEWMVDKHVVKMILESAQLLSTAHRLTDGVEKIEQKYLAGTSPAKYRKRKVWSLPDARQSVMYQATHINHPSAVWCRTSIENYNWLVEHMYSLLNEYTYRYGKTHSCAKMFLDLQSPPHKLKEWDWTTMPSCMAKEYIISKDPITNYRNYYKIGKAKIHKWTKRQPPEWINE